MSVTSKHLATFILGAAAGVALNKYLKTEEGEKLMEDLTKKGMDLKTEAEGAIEKAPAYFDALKSSANDKITEVIQNLKQQNPEAGNAINDIFASLFKSNTPPTTTINVDPK